MVSNASVDLPEPDSPVITMSLPRGSSTSMFFRLCSRAPLTTILSLIKILHQLFSFFPRRLKLPPFHSFPFFPLLEYPQKTSFLFFHFFRILPCSLLILVD